MAWDWIDNNCVKRIAIVMLCLLPTACSATTTIKAIYSNYQIGSIEYIVNDVVKELDAMTQDIKKAKRTKKINVAFEVGFGSEKRLPCDSELSIQLKRNFANAVTQRSRNFALPAFEYADIITFYDEGYLTESEIWKVDYVVFAEFQYDVLRGLAKVNVNILSVADKRIRKSLPYRLHNITHEQMMEYTKCSCERFCSQPQPILFRDESFGSGTQTRSCRSIVKTNRLALSNCNSKVMKKAVATNSRQPLSANQVSQKCNTCGGTLPSVESLKELALCNKTRRRIDQIACLDNGEVKLCKTGLQRITIHKIEADTRLFNKVQCEFNR